MFRPRAGKGGEVEFSAWLRTADISNGGCFLESTFTLRAGLAIEMEFGWPGLERKIHVAGEILRVIGGEPARRSGGHSGFAIRFTQFFGKSEIWLRAHLAKGGLYEFIAEFLQEEVNPGATPSIEQLAELVMRWGDLFRSRWSRWREKAAPRLRPPLPVA